MTAHREEHIDLCAGWALGTLDPPDRSRLEDHLATGCEKCARALNEFGDATILLAASLPPAAPSPALRARVLEAIGASTAPAPAAAPAPVVAPEPERAPGRVVELRPRRGGMFAALAFGAIAAALAVVSVISINNGRRLEGDLAANRATLEDVQKQLAAEKERGAVLDVLGAPGARIAVLASTDTTLAGVRARATYDPATQRAVIVFDNLRPQAGHDFELWAIRGTGPASLGVIKVDDQGHALLALENVGEAATLAAFAVSLEATGGSPTHDKPSGPVVMVGKLEG